MKKIFFILLLSLIYSCNNNFGPTTKKGIIDKDNGRKMVIDCAYELLAKINNEPALQAYLLDRPFTEKNIDISIHIVTGNDARVYYPDILFFSAYKGKIHFDTKSPDQKYGYKTEESETFDEAVKIVESQKIIMDEKNTIEKL